MIGIAIQTFIVIFLFYFIGALTYNIKEQKHFKFLKVLITFFATQIVNAIILVFLIVLVMFVTLIFSFLLLDNIEIPVDKSFFSNSEAGNMLLIILIFILVTSIIQFKLRKVALRKFPSLRLDFDEYEICEYFIQWMTIYLVIYQFLFDGLKKASKFLVDVTNVDSLFVAILSPDNINLVMQPLLIATWIVMVMEKINLREIVEIETKVESELDKQKLNEKIEATGFETDSKYFSKTKNYKNDINYDDSKDDLT